MRVKFIAQSADTALPTQCTGDVLTTALRNPEYTRLTFAVAYMRQSGIQRLVDDLQGFLMRGGSVAGSVGIKSKVTSREALQALLKLSSESTVFHTSTGNVTFHPKMYMLAGTQHALVLVGSPNLTGSGLDRNTEASIAVELDLSQEEDRALLKVCRDFLNTFLNPEHRNVQPLSEDLIRELGDLGLVISEAEGSETGDGANMASGSDADRLHTLFPSLDILSRDRSEIAGRIESRKEPARSQDVPHSEGKRSQIPGLRTESPGPSDATAVDQWVSEAQETTPPVRDIWPKLFSMRNLKGRDRYLVFLEGLIGDEKPQWWHFTWLHKSYTLLNVDLRKITNEDCSLMPIDIFNTARGRMECSLARGLFVNRTENRTFWFKELQRLNHTVRVAYLLQNRFGHLYRVQMKLPAKFSVCVQVENPRGTDSVIAATPGGEGNPSQQPALLVEVRGPAEDEYKLPRDFREEALIYAPIGDYWVLDPSTRQLKVYRGTAAPLSLSETDSIEPLMAPGILITVEELLPGGST